MRAVLLIVALTLGCGGPLRSTDRESACKLVQASRAELGRAGLRDLYQLSRYTPAESDARGAFAQRITSTTFGWLGAAALMTAFIDGFATNPATNPAARNAAYGLGAGAVGVLAAALILGLTSRKASEHARATLSSWADRCP